MSRAKQPRAEAEAEAEAKLCTYQLEDVHALLDESKRVLVLVLVERRYHVGHALPHYGAVPVLSKVGDSRHHL